MKRIAAIAGITLFALACAAQDNKQAAPPQGVAAEAKVEYNNIKTNITKMADAMTEENYSFKASPDIRTFGDLMQHIADAQTLYCTMADGALKRPEPSTGKPKAEVVAALKASFETCDAVFAKLTDASATETVAFGRGGQRTRLSVLWRNIAHSNEEYGYGAIYLRLKGVVPPSSVPR